MKTYLVKVTGVNGRGGNKVFLAGEIVTAKDFPAGHAEELAKSGALGECKGETLKTLTDKQKAAIKMVTERDGKAEEAAAEAEETETEENEAEETEEAAAEAEETEDFKLGHVSKMTKTEIGAKLAKMGVSFNAEDDKPTLYALLEKSLGGK